MKCTVNKCDRPFAARVSRERKSGDNQSKQKPGGIRAITRICYYNRNIFKFHLLIMKIQ